MTPATERFPAPVAAALADSGWEPGRWEIRHAEEWADTLRAHTSPGGHRHAVLPSAVEVWAEFGPLHIAPTTQGRDLAPTAVTVDPLPCLHAARTLSDLGRALGTEVCPIGTETEGEALLVVDAAGHTYGVDATGDWYLGPRFDEALTALLLGHRPARLTATL
ncbi:SUKH-3 domain-containing protein [Streptomyces xiaopingdaonensis]|uniref:SUKH-3 domain-containing protein n=1 Tax=Streptomyces xiaopingdaonensis TaxID=1565415 RepID=UPI0002F5BE2D|nr:SUKH-3 domain-containing protein [Streptomyces xiaopingdaonensis]